jgi:hypothetical protein
VYIAFDSDAMTKPGVFLALTRLKPFLESRGAIVRVVYLPSADDGTKVGLDDFLAAGKSIDDLLSLAVDELRKPAFKGDDDADDADDRPEVDAGELDLRRAIAQTWVALEQTNVPPTLFRFGGVAARIEDDEHGAPVVRPLDSDRTLFELGQRIRWIRRKETDDGTVVRSALPPHHVIRGTLATPRPPLPELVRIVEAPIFSEDGRLQIDPGYAPSTRALYVPAAGFLLPEPPEHPSAGDIARARGLIVDELLGDFPFVSPSERAHAVALLLLPFVRDLIVGPTPLHLIEKPSPGTGATLLVDMLLFPILGRPVAGTPEAPDEAEWRKRLTAKLTDGGPVLLIDNLRRRLDSSALAAAITMTTWEDRVLGVSRMVRLPVRCAWVATGNNPTLSNEIARRTVPIRLDAQHDQPWLRGDFRHPDLRMWTDEHLAELVWSVLVLGLAWLDAGRPAGVEQLGMFEQWASVIGGMLDVAGIPGFLGNLRQFYASSDFERAAWQAFLAAWWERHRTASVGVADLFEIAVNTDPALDLGEKGDRSQRTRLGKLIGGVRDRRFRIVRSDGGTIQVQVTPDTESHNAQRWRLRPVDVTNVDECSPGLGGAGRVRAPGREETPTTALSPVGGRFDVSHVHHVPPDDQPEALRVASESDDCPDPVSVGARETQGDLWGEV